MNSVSDDNWTAELAIIAGNAAQTPQKFYSPKVKQTPLFLIHSRNKLSFLSFFYANFDAERITMTRSGKKEHPLGNTSYSQLSQLSSNNYFTDIVYYAVELSCFPSLYHHSHLRIRLEVQT